MAMYDNNNTQFDTSNGLAPRPGDRIVIQTPQGQKEGWWDGTSARTS